MILGGKTCSEHILKINLTRVQSSDDVTLLSVIIFHQHKNELNKRKITQLFQINLNIYIYIYIYIYVCII